MNASTEIVSCDDLVGRSALDKSDDSAGSSDAGQFGQANIAESLMRSFEVRKFLSVEFRKSRKGINWVASSSVEIDTQTYLRAATLFNQAGEKFSDLRFINTALKILDRKCNGLADAGALRVNSVEIAGRLAHG